MKNQDMLHSYASDLSSIVGVDFNPHHKDCVEIHTLVRFPNGKVLEVNACLSVLELSQLRDPGLSLSHNMIERAIKAQSDELCRIIRSLDLWRLLSAH